MVTHTVSAHCRCCAHTKPLHSHDSPRRGVLAWQPTLQARSTEKPKVSQLVSKDGKDGDPE